MRKDVLKLQRDIIEGAPKGCSAYDRYAYNSFSHTAQYLSYSAQSDTEREFCMWLKGVAVKKAEELVKRTQEASR